MVGQTVGHFKILERLGAGGMGVVYKALDTHLDRLVAIKVLPADKVADPERKRRLVVEAKAASALNHPNIITIYDFSSENGIDFISMEYVPGKSMGETIPRKGFLLGAALSYAIQIADALAAAHAVGIIHRDLKPSNVMLSDGHDQGRAGSVKLLDFGLAKLYGKEFAADPTESTISITQANGLSTGDGRILGTVSYMSPEQAEGRKVDSRSDIFAFGALLYEMVTGRRAFQRDSGLSTLAAILREEPTPASQIVDGLPRDLERIIARCLRKAPERRFQTMADLKVALQELKDECEAGISPPPAMPRSYRKPPLVLAAALIAASATAGLTWFLRSNAAVPEAPLQSIPLTAYLGEHYSPGFSPDGNQVVFGWDGEKRDNRDIYVKLIGAGGPALRLTTAPAQDFSPAWSPDGRSIAFYRDVARDKADVFTIPAIGGPERKVGQVSLQEMTSLFISTLAWAPDSQSLVVSSRHSGTEPAALYVLSIDTAQMRKLTAPQAPLRADKDPAFSPDGHMLAFSRCFDANRCDLYLLEISDRLEAVGEPRRLTFANEGAVNPAWTANGHEIVFATGAAAGAVLWRMVVSDFLGRPGRPHRLTSEQGSSQPATSRQQNRLVYTRRVVDTNIWTADGLISNPSIGASAADDKSQLGHPVPLIASTREDRMPDLSRDGEKVVFVSDRSGSPEVWTCDTDASKAIKLTSFGGPVVSTPRWSPDRTQIAFDSDATGGWDIWIVGAGGGKPRRITTHTANDGNPSWSSDGQWIYFDSARTGQAQIWKVPASGGEPIQLSRDGGFAPIETLDGTSLFYTKSLSDTSVWRLRMRDGATTHILDGVASYSDMAVTDSNLYFVPTRGLGSGCIRALNFATNKVRTLFSVEKPLFGGIAISKNGKSILYTQHDRRGIELMLVENFR